MVVLLIMAVVLGTALPNFVDHQRRNKVETSAENLAARLKLARQKAIARRTKYRLTLNTVSGTYQLDRRETGGAWVADPPEVFILPDGIQMEAELGAEASNLDIILGPQGTVDSIDVPATIHFISEDDTLTVSVVRTGRIRVIRGS
ncbi:MAG: GspH/FimT family pseudopilin [Candidatus Eisenbacteria bacterium]|nr:GspH/FimT family pseudopilin [Candidatus Eisenbacteria bacterium]